jgi:hypothetical protein
MLKIHFCYITCYVQCLESLNMCKKYMLQCYMISDESVRMLNIQEAVCAATWGSWVCDFIRFLSLVVPRFKGWYMCVFTHALYPKKPMNLLQYGDLMEKLAVWDTVWKLFFYFPVFLRNMKKVSILFLHSQCLEICYVHKSNIWCNNKYVLISYVQSEY